MDRTVSNEQSANTIAVEQANLSQVEKDAEIMTSSVPAVRLDYEDVVNAWIAFIKKFSGVASAQSERSYRNAIRQLYRYFTEHGVNIFTATTDDVSDWLAYLREEKAPSTVQTYLVAVRLFYSFLVAEKFISESPCKAGDARIQAGVKIKRGVHKRDYLSTKQAKKMIAEMPAGTEKELRDRAIVSLMMTSGLRCCEVAAALYEDLRTAGDYDVLYIKGKGHTAKDDYVKVAPAVVEMIREYLRVRFNGAEPKGRDYLFISTSRNHKKLAKDDELSTQAIRAIAKAAFGKIGFKDSRHTAHSLRHTAATLMLRTGQPIENVKDVLRHENIQTTMVYAHALEREKNNAEIAVGNLIFGA